LLPLRKKRKPAPSRGTRIEVEWMDFRSESATT